ncbi:MAG: Saccharopine dehydrogenase [Alyxoria varia]|nr:MAG: Saccharopine dehydrogenase [Alyxoria varia]
MCAATVLHLRSETKPLEHRSALTPSTVKALIDAGYVVNIERSPVRIFDDEEFQDVGANLVPEGSWPQTPQSHIIIGLKELPETETFPLKHTHVQFAHCYKGQGGWEQVLARFPRGGGTLLDLEFLADEQGRRVAAFGYHAGFAGAALAVQAWAIGAAEAGNLAPMKGIRPYENEHSLLQSIEKTLDRGGTAAGRKPSAIVIGALGRCGRGAVDLLEKVGLPSDNILKWDLPETSAKSGPYQEIIESDIINTTFETPTVRVPNTAGPPVDVISIDHLPSLLPREASEAFSKALLPSLLQLKDRHTAPVWKGAEDLFKEKVSTLPHTSLNGSAA